MTRCPKCNRMHPDTVAVCDCGQDLEAYRRQLQQEAAAYQAASQPYAWLPIFRMVLRILGVFCLLGGVGSAILLLRDAESLWPPLLAIASAFIIAVPYFAFAEAISLLLAISTQQGEIQAALRQIEQAQKPANQ